MVFNTKTSPEPSVSREMRGLIQRLTMETHNTPLRIVVFVAARPREGTSTVAHDYAISAAIETGQKTLLIDAGPLAQSRYKKIGADPTKGIVEAAINETPIENACHPLGPGSFIARWCGRSENRSRAIRLMRDQELWDNLLKAFDTLVIDSASLQSSFDGVVMAARADATIMVVQAEATRQPVIENLRDSLAGAGAKIVGMVMNKRRFYIPRWVYRRL